MLCCLGARWQTVVSRAPNQQGSAAAATRMWLHAESDVEKYVGVVQDTKLNLKVLFLDESTTSKQLPKQAAHPDSQLIGSISRSP